MNQIELQVAGNTGMLPYRVVDGTKVFTFADVADGLGVVASTVRNAFARNADSWSSVETGVSHFETPSGIQETRWFNARGAMRFCRHMKSGRSDDLFDHLLDLFEKERAVIAQPQQLSIDVFNKFMETAGQIFSGLGGETREIRTKTIEIEAKVDALIVRVEPERLSAEIDAKVDAKLDDHMTAMDIRERQAQNFNDRATSAASQYVNKLMGHSPVEPLALAKWQAQRKVEFHAINGVGKEAAFGTPRSRIRNPVHARMALVAINQELNKIGILTATVPEIAETSRR